MPRVRRARRNEVDRAIEREFGMYGADRARTLVADAVLSQMLPACAVKGGAALKLRLGDAATRFTRDLDVSRPGAIEDFVDELSDSLAAGWHDFSGRVMPLEPAQIASVPVDYVMRPYEVAVWYRSRPWTTVALEVGHDEIGDTTDVEMGISPGVVELFRRLGLPDPAPVPLLAVHHQVAQKLHAVSGPGSERAHDLVDLQLIETECGIDLGRAREACVRLFAFRRRQAWPPRIEPGPAWESLYLEQRAGTDALPSLDEAISWANDLVKQIDQAGEQA